MDIIGNEDRLIVSRLAWEMAQWELHYLRGLFGTLIVEDILHGRRGQRLRHEYEEARSRALRDPDYRGFRPSPVCGPAPGAQESN